MFETYDQTKCDKLLHDRISGHVGLDNGCRTVVKNSTHARGIIGVNAAGYWAFFLRPVSGGSLL